MGTRSYQISAATSGIRGETGSHWETGTGTSHSLRRQNRTGTGSPHRAPSPERPFPAGAGRMARRPPGSSVQCPAGHAASLEQSSPGRGGGEERQRPPQVPPPGRLPPSGQAGVCDKACVTALATCRALGSTRNHLARRASPGSTKEAGLQEGVGGRSARPTADTGDSPVQNQCADHSTPAE